MRSAKTFIALLPFAFALAGCPSNWAMNLRAYGADRANTSVYKLDARGVPVALEGVPLEHAKVTLQCDGCSEKVELKEYEGAYWVDVGTSWSTPKPSVLTVAAPGYVPATIEIRKPMRDSSGGYGSLVVILRPVASPP